jgi:hypothetical protein
MESNHRVTGGESSHSFSNGGNDARRFVAKDSWRLKQAILDLLQVCMANPTGLHAYQNLSCPNGWYGNRFEVYNLPAAVYGCPHGFRYGH